MMGRLKARSIGMSSARKRGRPVGSSKLHARDFPLLESAAGIMVHENVTLTQALRRLGVSSESELHRLRRKWKPIAPLALGEARRARSLAAMQQRMQHTASILNSPHVRRIGEMLDALSRSEHYRRNVEGMQAFLNSPQYATAREALQRFQSSQTGFSQLQLDKGAGSHPGPSRGARGR
jgi:hypothetical protein